MCYVFKFEQLGRAREQKEQPAEVNNKQTSFCSIAVCESIVKKRRWGSMV